MQNFFYNRFRNYIHSRWAYRKLLGDVSLSL